MKDKKAKLIYGDRGKEMVELSKGVGFIKRGDINACPGWWNYPIFCLTQLLYDCTKLFKTNWTKCLISIEFVVCK